MGENSEAETHLSSTIHRRTATVQAIAGKSYERYTHVGRESIRSAIETMPSLSGKGSNKEQVVRVSLADLKSMTDGTWRGIRDRLVAGAG